MVCMKRQQQYFLSRYCNYEKDDYGCDGGQDGSECVQDYGNMVSWND